MQVWSVAATSSSVVVFSVCVCVCVCVRPYWKEVSGKWNRWGGGLICPSIVDGLAITGKSLAAANAGVRCMGDGVDSCVQVGGKTLAVQARPGAIHHGP